MKINMIIKFNVTYDMKNYKICDQEKMEYINLFESTINQILEISNVELNEDCKIIITENFKEEVEEFQKRQDLSIGYTDNFDDETWGITLDYLLYNKINVNVFLNKKVLFGLKVITEFDGTTVQQFCINIIHHELMHTYDMLQSKCKYDTILNYKQDDASKRNLNTISIMIWKEYFADRMASKTFIGNYFKVLYEKVYYCQNRIRAIIEVNKQCGNIDKMYNDVNKMIIISLRFMSYRLGKLYNGKDNKEISELVEIENEKLINSFIGNIYMEFFNELNKLFDNYLKWDINDFDNLNALIRRVYNFFGISLNSSEDGNKLIVLLLSSF